MLYNTIPYIMYEYTVYYTRIDSVTKFAPAVKNSNVPETN